MHQSPTDIPSVCTYNRDEQIVSPHKAPLAARVIGWGFYLLAKGPIEAAGSNVLGHNEGSGAFAIELCPVARSACDARGHRVHATENPPLRQLRDGGNIWGDGFLVFRFPIYRWHLALGLELCELLFLPATTALNEESAEQFSGRLSVRMLRAPLSGQCPLNRRLQHRGTIELQLRPRTLQRRHRSVEVREEFVECVGDADLFSSGSHRNSHRLQK